MLELTVPSPVPELPSLSKHLPVRAYQGGTCVMVGDDSKRIAEAEELAQAQIGCKILRSSSYFRPEGHVQVLLLSLHPGSSSPVLLILCRRPAMSADTQGQQSPVGGSWRASADFAATRGRRRPWERGVMQQEPEFGGPGTTEAHARVRAQYDFNHQSYADRCLGTVDFLADIEMLAHTDYAVLTFNSGLAHLVDTLR